MKGKADFNRQSIGVFFRKTALFKNNPCRDGTAALALPGDNQLVQKVAPLLDQLQNKVQIHLKIWEELK